MQIPQCDAQLTICIFNLVNDFFSCPNLSGRHENVPLSFLLACFRFSNSECAALSCSPLSHSLFARESRLSLAILCMQLTSAAAES